MLDVVPHVHALRPETYKRKLPRPNVTNSPTPSANERIVNLKPLHKSMSARHIFAQTLVHRNTNTSISEFVRILDELVRHRLTPGHVKTEDVLDG